MIIADLIVIAIIALSVFIGIKRGFLRSVIGFLSIIISLILAVWTYPVVADVINNTEIKATITEAVENSLGEEKSSATEEKKDESGISALPKAALEAIEKQTEAITETAIQTTAQTVSTLAVNLISILLVFIVVRLIMFLISTTLGFITKLPVIKSVNRLLGGALGALCGILAVYLILTLITFNTALNSNAVIGKAVKESYIASQMYDNNFIVNWISGD